MATKKNTSYQVRPDKHTTEEINNLTPSESVIVYDTDEKVNKFWNGTEWVSTDGRSSEEDAATLSHFRYNPETDTLEADRSIETTLSSLYLGKQHGIHSAGENVVFTNESTGVNWFPTWQGITKTEEYKATTRTYSELQTITETEGTVVSDFRELYPNPNSISVFGFKVKLGQALALGDIITYNVYYYNGSQTDVIGSATFEANKNGKIYEQEIIVDADYEAGDFFQLNFTHPVEVHAGQVIYDEVILSDDSYLQAKESTTPNIFFQEIFTRTFTDILLATQEDISGIVSGSQYKGGYDADQDLPTLPNTAGGGLNGDIYRVSVSGGSYEVGDVLIFNEVSDSYDHIPVKAVTQDSLEQGGLKIYDWYVKPDYVGTVFNGSAHTPFLTLDDAISASSDGDSIFLDGINTITSEIVLPHGLHIIGSTGSKVKYGTYDVSNGNVFNYNGAYTHQFVFENLTIENAGGYGILAKKALVFEIRRCKFFYNGWDGTNLNTVADSATSGVLGYDSTSADLQAFYAGTHASNGGAVRIQECPSPLIRESRAQYNLRGFRVQDCGIGGGGFIIENQSIMNIESGIYLAAGSQGGCQNITTTINYSAYNANNGLLAIGGINNKFSQNEVYGNWNAGFCGWGAANLTLRDSGLYDNNRSQYNGIGNTGDAKASIQLNDAYSFIATQLAYNPDFRFIAEILDTQVHYTGVGSNTEKVGFLMTSGMGNIPDNDKNIIKIDDVGFIGQDYAIDLSEVDISNLRLSLGDNSYQSIGEKAVKAPLQGNYSELPFSNHVMQVPEVDIVVDTLKQTIALHEGVGGNVINMYGINELQSLDMGTHIDIIQRGSDKIQLRGLTLGNVYVNGVLAGNDVSSMNDTVNAALNMNLTQYTNFLQTDVFDYTEDGNSPPIVETNEVIADGTNYNSSYMTLGVADGNGESTLISQQNGDNKADVWSNVPINQMGEYSIFQTDSAGGGKRFYVGFTTDDQLGNLADGVGNGHEGMQWSVAIYDGYDAPWTFYGTQASASYNSAWWGNNQNFRDHSGILTNKVTWKVGIEDDGKFYVYFWSLIDEEWKYLAKTNYTLVGDDYHPMVRFYTNGGGFYNGFDNFRYEEVEDVATFYYIESPDGVFHYPLFQTEAEANLIDETLGGTGTSHTHTYVDDLTGTTWYMPDTGGTMSGNAAPVNGDFTVGGNTITDVNWNEQVTDADSNYAPTFTDIVYTIAEGSAVNIQYKPQGDTSTYNVTNVPSGYADNGYAIIGTAETITDGVDIQHVINVTKANDYGSAVGTITLNVTDDASNNATANGTSWTKAIDFGSGSSEYLQQVHVDNSLNALRMGGQGQTVNANYLDASLTTNAHQGRPWATTAVFKPEFGTGGEYIWNCGGGSANNKDNIALRTSGTSLYFSWGRDAYQSICLVEGGLTVGEWYGVYIAFKGQKYSGTTNSSANMADAFDIRLMSSADNFASVGSNKSTAAAWVSTSNMGRSMAGAFTIGGQGSAKSHDGKVASMVVTSLKQNSALPTDLEVKAMITDPTTWVTDYKVGQSYRQNHSDVNVTNFQLNQYQAYSATQVWLFGDGTNDNLMSNGIRNQINPNDQNYTRLQGTNLQSNDTENVTIQGLS